MKRHLLFVALFSLSAAVHAVDGVVLIDQSKALAGNVTPGDTPGFPITLSKPGSYKLTGNLVLPDANTDGIVSTAGNVSIDLNGFTISGPTRCDWDKSNGGVLCDDLGSAIGILLTGEDNAVRGGGIVGMGSQGIVIKSGIVENLQVRHAGWRGIAGSQGSIMRNNTVAFIGSAGISGGVDTVISGNTVTSTGSGIASSGLVTGNAVFGNHETLSCDYGLGGYSNNVLRGGNQITGCNDLGGNLIK